MPGAKQAYRRAQRYRKRRFRRRGRAPLTKRQVAAVSKIANRKISSRAEKKYYDRALTGQAYDWAGSIVSLTNIPQGDTDVTRDGDQVYLRSIRMSGDIVIGDTTNVARLIIFQWYQDATPAYTDVLSSVYQGTVNAVNSPYHHDGRRQFRVLYDKRFVMDSDDGIVLFDTGYLRPAKRKINFNAGGTDGENEIFMLALSDSGAVSHPSFNFVCRTTFNDM